MTVFAWLLALAVLVSVLAQGVSIHRATVCRQKAWLASAELLTRSKLSSQEHRATLLIPSCHSLVQRTGETITWRRGAVGRSQAFQVHLSGQL